MKGCVQVLNLQGQWCSELCTMYMLMNWALWRLGPCFSWSSLARLGHCLTPTSPTIHLTDHVRLIWQSLVRPGLRWDLTQLQLSYLLVWPEQLACQIYCRVSLKVEGITKLETYGKFSMNEIIQNIAKTVTYKA